LIEECVNTKEEVKEIVKLYIPSSKPEIKNVSFVILALKGKEGKVRGSSVSSYSDSIRIEDLVVMAMLLF
jgi:hypothetical protein